MSSEGSRWRTRAITVATSKADDAAFRALEDVSRMTRHFEDARIVGGQMVSLLLTAFPAHGTITRRTADADAAISTTVAASGDIHAALTHAGYVATTGNHYEKHGAEIEDPASEIDLLVPSTSSTFGRSEHGGRGFDAAPGLSLALAAQPLVIHTEVTLTNGSAHAFEVRVPPVEVAVVLKAYATQSRNEAKDYTDLFNLLSIAYEYRANPERIGGWRFSAAARGTREDAARILHDLADRVTTIRTLNSADIPRERLVALIRALVMDGR